MHQQIAKIKEGMIKRKGIKGDGYEILIDRIHPISRDRWSHLIVGP
jgi:hypothetical protein